MHRGIRHRMELHVTGQNPVFRAIDFDIDKLNIELRIGQFFAEHAALQRQHDGFFLVAVDNGRYQSVAAGLTRGPLTGAFPRRGRYGFDLGHDCLL